MAAESKKIDDLVLKRKRELQQFEKEQEELLVAKSNISQMEDDFQQAAEGNTRILADFKGLSSQNPMTANAIEAALVETITETKSFFSDINEEIERKKRELAAKEEDSERNFRNSYQSRKEEKGS